MDLTICILFLQISTKLPIKISTLWSRQLAKHEMKLRQLFFKSEGEKSGKITRQMNKIIYSSSIRWMLTFNKKGGQTLLARSLWPSRGNTDRDCIFIFKWVDKKDEVRDVRAEHWDPGNPGDRELGELSVCRLWGSGYVLMAELGCQQIR